MKQFYVGFNALLKIFPCSPHVLLAKEVAEMVPAALCTADGF